MPVQVPGIDDTAGVSSRLPVPRLLAQTAMDTAIRAGDPDDLPYSYDLPAVMSYQMSLSRQTHTAYPTLWDGAKVTDPAEMTTLAGKAGEHVREEP